jgi:hypothetical protein
MHACRIALDILFDYVPFNPMQERDRGEILP